MTSHRISVIVPCHNYGRFLPEAVASVFAQTRPPDEVVIVDDGSTDDTPQVLGGIVAEHPAVRVISRRPARGIVATRNDAIRATTGSLVVNLDADDRLSPTYLEQLEPAFRDPRVGVAYTPERHFGAVDRWQRRPWSEREHMRRNLVNSSAMFRRSLFDAVGGFSPRFDRLGLEDWEFWVRCVKQGTDVRFVDGAHLEYRQHATGGRNRMPYRRYLRAHVTMWWLHRPVISLSDVGVGIARSVRYQIRKRSASARGTAR